MKKKCECEHLFEKVAIPLGYTVEGTPQQKASVDYCAVVIVKGERREPARNPKCGDFSHEHLRDVAHRIGLMFGAPPAKAKAAPKAKEPAEAAP